MPPHNHRDAQPDGNHKFHQRRPQCVCLGAFVRIDDRRVQHVREIFCFAFFGGKCLNCLNPQQRLVQLLGHVVGDGERLPRQFAPLAHNQDHRNHNHRRQEQQHYAHLGRIIKHQRQRHRQCGDILHQFNNVGRHQRQHCARLDIEIIQVFADSIAIKARQIHVGHVTVNLFL